MRDYVNYYTVYDRNKERMIAYGNIEECSVKLKMNEHTFYSMVSRLNSGKNKKYEIEISREMLDD